jgi:predicted Ser/Thr protein kinase
VRVPDSGLLGGRYLLGERIGSGGMGTVHRAHDTRLDRPVAVKLLHEGRDVDEVTRARLRAEARFAGSLQHPGIVQVFDYGEEPGPAGPTPYVVMAYVEGTPLSDLLRDSGALPVDRVAELLVHLARALAVAHAAGIVHRDLKPSNVLITPAGRPVLVDFGVARSDTAEPLTETGLIIGSADYLSPEQVLGQRASAASDVFALGVVVHQCLGAISPFRRDTQAATALARLHDDPPALPESVPWPLRMLVARMLARDPAERPTAVEVAERAAAQKAAPTRVLPPMPTSPPPPPRTAPRTAPTAISIRRGWTRPRLAATAAAAAIVLLAATVVALQGRGATPPAGAADLVVPSVRGDRVAHAVRALDKAGFEVVRTAVDGPQQAGLVLGQSPRPGPFGGAEPVVTLRVASGWVAFDDDLVRGASYAAARRAVAARGLVPSRATRLSTVAPGTVVAATEGRLQVGSTVVLTVATAPPRHVTAPRPASRSRHHGQRAHHPKPGKAHGPKAGKGHGPKAGKGHGPKPGKGHGPKHR